jgi:hypothetical protein
MLTLTAALIVGGCQTTAGNFCDVERVWRPSPGVAYSEADKRRIVAFNEYGEKTCGWKP